MNTNTKYSQNPALSHTPHCHDFAGQTKENNNAAQKQQVAARSTPIGLIVGTAITAAVTTANITHAIKAAKTSTAIGTWGFADGYLCGFERGPGTRLLRAAWKTHQYRRQFLLALAFIPP